MTYKEPAWENREPSSSAAAVSNSLPQVSPPQPLQPREPKPPRKPLTYWQVWATVGLHATLHIWTTIGLAVSSLHGAFALGAFCTGVVLVGLHCVYAAKRPDPNY